MERDFLAVEFRSVDDDQRIIEGIANTASVDSFHTVLDPAGAVFELPIPLHLHHDKRSPVGNVIATELRAGKRWIRAQIAKVADDGTEGGRDVKRRVDGAWADVKAGLLRGLSVEFVPIEPRSMTAKRWTKWRWSALGLVTAPSNMDTTISLFRSADPSPGRTGIPTDAPTPRRGHMTIQEQIQQHENSRAAKVARKSALMESSNTRGSTLDTAEAEEFDTLSQDVTTIDGHLVRLNSLKADNDRAAVPITTATTIPRPGVPVVQVRSNTEPGIQFARYAMSLLRSKGNRYEAADYARAAWGDPGEEIALMHRAAIAPGTTVQATFAAPLVGTNFLNEFLEMLRPATILGKIPGLRRVPFNVSMPSQTAGGTYKWVGEGKPKPLTNAQFAAVTLGMNKQSGIIVLTEELVRSSSPSAELVVRNELRDGITAFSDVQFTDPAIAAVATVNPASITNGVAGTAASGVTEAAARADLRALVGSFVTGNFGAAGLVLLMNEGIAFTLGSIMNAVGAPAFPGLTATGGTLLGIPVVTSNAITAATGIIALHAPSILLADEGGIEIDVSREASLQMDSAPADPADATTVMISMFQNNLVALRVEQYITWGKARANSVNRIHTVAYA